MVPSAEAERLRQAGEMADLGVEIMRQSLRRRNPDATDEEISELLQAWRCPPTTHPGTVRTDFS